MIRRFHEAKKSGRPPLVSGEGGDLLMETYDGADLLNVGVGEDLTIAELAEMVARVVG